MNLFQHDSVLSFVSLSLIFSLDLHLTRPLPLFFSLPLFLSPSFNFTLSLLNIYFSLKGKVLTDAAKQGSVGQVKKYLEGGTNVDSKDKVTLWIKTSCRPILLETVYKIFHTRWLISTFFLIILFCFYLFISDFYFYFLTFKYFSYACLIIYISSRGSKPDSLSSFISSSEYSSPRLYV